MPYKSRMCDIYLGFLLLCGAGVIVPYCSARCDINDVNRCLPGIFGSNDVDSFRCSQSGKTCINNLRRSCVNSGTYRVISEIANLAEYSCSSQGQNDVDKYTECLTNIGSTSAGVTQVTIFTNTVQTCARNLERGVNTNSLSSICRASRSFETCIVAAFNRLCQDAAARRFFGKFANLVEVGGCFSQSGAGAAIIPSITKLSMAVWAGILTFFFI